MESLKISTAYSYKNFTIQEDLVATMDILQKEYFNFPIFPSSFYPTSLVKQNFRSKGKPSFSSYIFNLCHY